MAAARPRSAPGTRAAILAAARARFAAEGYERTTLRAVAGDVGVDAAMVIRYFGCKEALFAAAADLAPRLPDLTGLTPEQVPDVLLPHFFTVWEDDGSFLALLRASVTSATAAAAMREVFATRVAPALSVVTPDHPMERASMVGALVLGVALDRYVIGTEPLATMSRAELSAWLGPVLSRLLTGPAPTPYPSPPP